jgi:hypothetical protein
METTKKAFDAVAESRKWREATSRKLDAMPTDERVTYLRALGEQYASEHVSRHPKRASEAVAAA